MFSKFIMCVNALIVKVRAMYMPTSYNELADKYASFNCGWLVVCHDGWDSISKRFFNVSVYWIDMQSWIRYKLALNMVVPNGHDAQACNDGIRRNDAAMAILKHYGIRRNDAAMAVLKHYGIRRNDVAMAVLKHYGIRRNDIVLSINNTISASVATDRLIVGMDDTYNMHLANLACDHATGKRKRTLNKEIVDSFEECKDLRLAVRQMIRYVWNKKAKSRKINYEKCNE
jgi:hypothetical protein